MITQFSIWFGSTSTRSPGSDGTLTGTTGSEWSSTDVYQNPGDNGWHTALFDSDATDTLTIANPYVNVPLTLTVQMDDVVAPGETATGSPTVTADGAALTGLVDQSSDGNYYDFTTLTGYDNGSPIYLPSYQHVDTLTYTFTHTSNNPLVIEFSDPGVSDTLTSGDMIHQRGWFLSAVALSPADGPAIVSIAPGTVDTTSPGSTAPATFVVSRNNTDAPLTVTLDTPAGTAARNTYTLGGVSDNQVSFATGQSTATVTLTANGNAAPGTSSVTLGLAASESYAVTTAPATDDLDNAETLTVCDATNPSDSVTADQSGEQPDLYLGEIAGSDIADIELTANLPSGVDPTQYHWYVKTADGEAVADGAFGRDGEVEVPLDLTPPGGLSLPNFDFVATMAYGDSAPTTSSPAVDVDVLHASVETVSDNTPKGILDPALETGTDAGIYVPLDVLDEDYADDGNVQDRKRTTPVVGGDHLMVPIVLPAGFCAVDSIPRNIELFSDQAKAHAIVPSVLIHSDGKTKIYAEGCGLGTGTLVLSFFGDGNWGPVVTQSVEVTTFWWGGPQNVPGNGTYTYQAVAPDGSDWTGGIVGGSAVGTWSKEDPDREEDHTSVSVRWDNTAAVVGHVTFQADSNYSWDYLVNVVRITVGPPAHGKAFNLVGAAHQDGDGPQQGRVKPIVFKFALSAALNWTARVTAVGPDGHGADKITAGFIQNVTQFSDVGLYNPRGTQKLVASPPPTLPQLDVMNEEAGGAPWYQRSTNQNFTSGVPVEMSSKDDAPGAIVPETFQQLAELADPNNPPIYLEHWDLNEQFALDVCAATSDAEGYAEEATATWGLVIDKDTTLREHVPFNAGGTLETTKPTDWTAPLPNASPPVTAGHLFNAFLKTLDFN